VQPLLAAMSQSVVASQRALAGLAEQWGLQLVAALVSLRVGPEMERRRQLSPQLPPGEQRFLRHFLPPK
jgi:hypothetical protein